MHHNCDHLILPIKYSGLPYNVLISIKYYHLL